MKQDIKYVSVGMYKQLQEENRNLKEKLEIEKLGHVQMIDKVRELENNAMLDMKYISDLEEQIKRLKEANRNLTKCNLNLQEHIDKIEKENKKLNEELSIYDREYFDEDKKHKVSI